MKKYMPFFRVGMIEEMAYRAGLLAWVLITFLQLICVVFLWISVYKNAVSDVINGFTFKEMIVYFVVTNIFAFICLESQTLHDINTEIKDGTIAISFIKPVSYRLRFLYRCMGACACRSLLVGIPSLVIAFIAFISLDYIRIGSVPGFIVHIVLFIIATILAVAIYDTIDYICGVMCFYTTAAWGLNFSKSVLVSFFSGVLIPLSFFPGKSANIVKVLPFAGLSQNPVSILTLRVDIETSVKYILNSIFWLIIFSILAKLIFNRASRKVTVQGE